MTKYVCVAALADDQIIEKGEHVIITPDFVQDVRDCRQHSPSSGLLSPVYARALIDFIGHKYDPNFPGAGKFVVQEINGVPFKDEADIAKAIAKLFRKYYPAIVDSYITYQIRNIPFGTKLIYFVGDFLDTSAFIKNGIDSISIKDVDVYMGRKDKKINKGGFKKLEDKPNE